MQVFGTLLHQLASQEAHRDDVVIALGGGTVGDLAGFVASTYMRGVRLVQVPTTLIGQVDAAIGGKTAVNLPEGKNLVGTFYQPLAVLCDVTTLSTLPDRDYRSGLGEVAKYALALEPELLELLEGDLGPIVDREPGALEALVARCVRIKASTVAADERDVGARMFLNYGHTLGHALERLEAFAGRSHGEAIAVGMVFAARLAESRGLAAEGLSGRTIRLLTSLGLEVDGALPPVRDILSAFRMDKKFHGGVRFVRHAYGRRRGVQFHPGGGAAVHRQFDRGRWRDDGFGGLLPFPSAEPRPAMHLRTPQTRLSRSSPHRRSGHAHRHNRARGGRAQ